MLKKAYICHPFSNNPAANYTAVLNILKDLIFSEQKSHLPVCPWLTLTQFLNDAIPHHRTLALEYCQAYINTMKPKHDELWVYGKSITPGMTQEISWAKAKGLNIVNRSISITQADINNIK